MMDRFSIDGSLLFFLIYPVAESRRADDGCDRLLMREEEEEEEDGRRVCLPALCNDSR